MPEKILVICAHNDDNIFGLGGTIARYLKEGKKVKTIIFSYGEGSHPWLKKKESITMRVKECQKADKILGGNQSTYLGAKEFNFEKEVEKKKIDKNIRKIIKKYNPSKIFTHGMDDPHPDHRAVNSIVLNIIDKINYDKDVYTFDVWNPIRIRKRTEPKLIIDTSKTFKLKIKALNCHKSQKAALISLLWNVYRKDFFNGLANNCRFAEVFYKVR